MTLFQETTAAGEKGAGAPGGAHRHLPPPAAPAALAPPREAAPPSMRGLWPPRYKGAAVRASARVGRQLTERKPPFTRPPVRPLLCFATLQPSTAGGRARRTSGWPRDAERTVAPFRILGLPPRLKTLKCPIGLWGPAGLLRRLQNPGTTAPHIPVCGLQGGQCAPLGTDPPGRLQDKRGATALKLSPCHAKHLRAELWLR